MKAIKGCN